MSPALPRARVHHEPVQDRQRELLALFHGESAERLGILLHRGRDQVQLPAHLAQEPPLGLPFVDLRGGCYDTAAHGWSQRVEAAVEQRRAIMQQLLLQIVHQLPR